MKEDIKARIDMINKGEIPEGYKETKIGIIPNEWNICDLSKYIKALENGVSINGLDRCAVNNECGILKTSAISSNGFNINENKAIINNQDKDKLSKNVKDNTIVICRKNTADLVGTVNYVEYGNEKIFLPDLIWQAEFNDIEKINPRWLSYMLNTDRYDKYKKSIATGTSKSMPNITKPNFLKFEIYDIEKEEQDKIDNIIFTWDKAIKLKEELIMLNKSKKQGLEQKLLTSKFRIDGFEENVKSIKLSDVISESKEVSTDNNQYEILSVTKNGIFNQRDYFNRQIASEDNTGYKVVRKNNLVFSSMNLWMGSIDILDKYDVGIVSPACKVFEINLDKVDIDFFKFYIKSGFMMNLYATNSEQGASVVRRNLDLKGLLSSRIKLPKIEEQRYIGKILRESENEISLLEKELDAIKEQKKGLMQLLLTGIARV